MDVFAVLKRAFDMEEQSKRLYRIMKEEGGERVGADPADGRILRKRDLSVKWACGLLRPGGSGGLRALLGLHRGKGDAGIQPSVVFIGPWYFRRFSIYLQTKAKHLWIVVARESKD